VPDYIPDAGDVVWLQFNPQASHEQAGHRLALVVSPQSFNRSSGMAVFCPLTTKIKGYPFEVLEEIEGEPSAILVDQVRAMDWSARSAKFKARVSNESLQEVRGKLAALIGLRD
jgi:mRNA interferase MazF